MKGCINIYVDEEKHIIHPYIYIFYLIQYGKRINLQ